MKQRVLVTGATGRLGRELVRVLAAAGDIVRAFVLPDDDTSGLPDGVEIHRGNLLDADAVHSAVDDVNAIVHLAAMLPGPGVDERLLFSSIVDGTMNLLTGIVRSGRSASTNFVYASSSAVYGPQHPSVPQPISESQAIRPTSIYGCAKASAEMLVMMHGQKYDLPYTIIRPSDIVTPRDLNPPQGYVYSRFAPEPGAEFNAVFLRTDNSGASNSLSAIGATDLAGGFLLALKEPAAAGEIFHLGPITQEGDVRLAEAFASNLQLPVRKLATLDSAKRWELDSSKAVNTLGFQCLKPVSTMIEDECFSVSS